MRINRILALTLISASVVTAGCEEKTPNDKLTSETIKPIAEREAISGIVVDDFKKENGWQDTNATNTYHVRYSYNLKLTQPLPEVALGLANQILSDINKAKENPGWLGGNEFQASMGLIQEASDWVNTQNKQEFPARRDAFLTKCKPCIDYWNRAGQDNEVRERKYAYLAAWSRLESLGYKDTSTIGDKVPRLAWAGFMKTEQGWRAINN